MLSLFSGVAVAVVVYTIVIKSQMKNKKREKGETHRKIVPQSILKYIEEILKC